MVIFLLTTLAALCLIMALGSIKKSSDSYDQAFKRTKQPDITILYQNEEYEDDYPAILAKQSEVASVSLDGAVPGRLWLKKKKIDDVLLINWESETVDYHVYSEEQLTLKQGEVILPSIFQPTYKLEPGDTIVIELSGRSYPLIIKKFVEEPGFGSPVMGLKKLFISPSDYQTFQESQPANNYHLVGVTLSRSLENQGQAIQKVIKTFGSERLKNGMQTDVSFQRSGTLLIVNLFMGIFLLFALLLLIIVIIILRFALLATIESDYVQIGILKSLGTSRQLIWLSLIVQYTVIVLSGTLVGAIMSYILTPLFGTIIHRLSGIVWEGPISGLIVFAVIGGMTLFISLLIGLNAKKVLTISPVEAIAYGQTEVEFSSLLAVPLKKLSWLPLSLRLGLKQLLLKWHQYLSLLIISGLFGFLLLTMIGLSDFFSDIQKTMAYFNFAGVTTVDIEVSAPNGLIDKDEKFKQLEKVFRQETAVSYASRYGFKRSEIAGKNVNLYIYDRYPAEMQLVEGRLPRYDNELMTTPLLAKTLGVTVGGQVKVESNGSEKAFVISGLYQSASEMGATFAMTLKSYQKFDPEASLPYLAFNLVDDSQENKERLLKSFEGNEFGLSVQDGQKLAKSMSKTIQQALSSVIVGIVVISLCMIMLASILLSTITLKREQKDNGIFKAIGYTAFQLQKQLLARFMLISLVGSLIGITVAYFTSSQLISMILFQIGIAKLVLSFSVKSCLFVSAFIVGSTAISTWLLSFSIYRVSPKELMTE